MDKIQAYFRLVNVRHARQHPYATNIAFKKVSELFTDDGKKMRVNETIIGASDVLDFDELFVQIPNNMSLAAFALEAASSS